MEDSPAVIDQVHRDRRLRLAFLSAVVSLAAAFAASSAPIPLFNLYRAQRRRLPEPLSGQLSSTFSLPQIALRYGGLALLTTLFTIAAVRNPTSERTSRS
jgi:hypothetical protein